MSEQKKQNLANSSVRKGEYEKISVNKILL